MFNAHKKIIWLAASSISEVNIDETPSTSEEQSVMPKLRTNGELPLNYKLPAFGAHINVVLEKYQKIFNDTCVPFFPSKAEKGKILTSLYRGYI